MNLSIDEIQDHLNFKENCFFDEDFMKMRFFTSKICKDERESIVKKIRLQTYLNPVAFNKLKKRILFSFK